MNCTVFSLNREQAQRLQETTDEELFSQQLQAAPHLELGKNWHGLHYLLIRTAWETPDAHGFLVEGGDEIGPDVYGPARLFSPREVDDIHSALVDVTEDELWAHFDADDMNEQVVYPGLDWHEEPELTRQIYTTSFRELQKFVDEASRRGQCLVVTIV